MRKFSHLLAGIAVIILASLACNLPSNNPNQQGSEAVMTAAAMTVQAQLTNIPSTAPTFTSSPAPFPTAPLPTFAPPTLPPSPTPTQNCDNAQFITDVTYPDDTPVAPNTNFTKTWRLKNVGVCSWTPSYAVIFFSGDQMNGPSVQALSGNVNPGQTVDISVDLTSPASTGTKTGYWKLRNASGVAFAQFYVQIKVQNTSSSNVVTLTAIGGEGGSVRSDGTVLVNVPNVGDTDANITSEAFFSFDISGIPAGATITKVVPNLAGYDTLGSPFTISDGCVRVYVQDYGTLGAGDFYAGDPLGAAARWCSTAELDDTVNQPDMVTALQSKLGDSRFQFRIQFRVPTTNSNGVADMIRFGAVKLKITYTTP